MRTKMPEVTQEIQTTDLRRRPQPEDGPLTIIYEDNWTLVVNKPVVGTKKTEVKTPTVDVKKP